MIAAALGTAIAYGLIPLGWWLSGSPHVMPADWRIGLIYVVTAAGAACGNWCKWS